MSDEDRVTTEPVMQTSRKKFLLSIGYAGLIVLFVSILPRTSGPLMLATFFLILAIPAGVFMTYLATLRRIYWLSMLSSDSFAMRWLSGPWLGLAVGILTAFLMAAVLSVRLSVASWIDLLLLGACIATLGVVLLFLGNWLRRQFQPFYREGRPLFWASIISAGLMSLLDPAARFLAAAYNNDRTLREAIDEVGRQATWLGDSAVAHFVSGLGSAWAGLEHWLLGRLIEAPGFVAWLALALSGLIRFPLYLAVSITACAFILPLREYMRILLPGRAGYGVEDLSVGRVAGASASATILIFFIYFPIVAVMETTIEKHPSAQSPEEVVVRTVELIGEHYYPEGTVHEIDALATSMMADHNESLDRIEGALDDGFEMIRENVDFYLDWYYSLPGEWGRVASLLAGNIENHLSDKLSEALERDQPFDEFEQALETALEYEAQRSEEFRRRANELLEARRAEVAPNEEVEVARRVEREEMLSLSAHSGMTTLEQRLGVTAATSGISGVVAAAATRQVLARVATRGTIRAAGAAIARLASIRAASGGGGAAAGAAAGGAVGSFVPGVGTVIGAAVGGVIGGVTAGVGAEFLILKLEELWSREGHRDELLGAIDDAEAEIRLRFGL